MGQALDRHRLARILGMLGSGPDGEALAAGRAANEFVRASGLTGFNIVAPARPLSEPTRHREVETDNDAIDFALDFADVPREWEFAFCRSIAEQSFALSPKQRAVLSRIVGKVRRVDARTAA
jgi:hypothetical protein